jgi:hypothetical protein
MPEIVLDEDEYLDEEREPEVESSTAEDDDDLSAFDNPLVEDIN